MIDFLKWLNEEAYEDPLLGIFLLIPAVALFMGWIVSFIALLASGDFLLALLVLCGPTIVVTWIKWYLREGPDE